MEATQAPNDEEIDAALSCPICMAAYWEPLRLPSCGHVLCRVCLIQSTHLAPDGRSCPMCRETITIKDPRTEPADATLTAAVADAVSPELLEARAKDAESVLQLILDLCSLPLILILGSDREFNPEQPQIPPVR